LNAFEAYLMFPLTFAAPTYKPDGEWCYGNCTEIIIVTKDPKASSVDSCVKKGTRFEHESLARVVSLRHCYNQYLENFMFEDVVKSFFQLPRSPNKSHGGLIINSACAQNVLKGGWTSVRLTFLWWLSIALAINAIRTALNLTLSYGGDPCQPVPIEWVTCSAAAVPRVTTV
jgi:hypothetical protein